MILSEVLRWHSFVLLLSFVFALSLLATELERQLSGRLWRLLGSCDLGFALLVLPPLLLYLCQFLLDVGRADRQRGRAEQDGRLAAHRGLGRRLVIMEYLD